MVKQGERIPLACSSYLVANFGLKIGIEFYDRMTRDKFSNSRVYLVVWRFLLIINVEDNAEIDIKPFVESDEYRYVWLTPSFHNTVVTVVPPKLSQRFNNKDLIVCALTKVNVLREQ